MTFMENQYLFSHPFATLTSANYRKYPNEYSHHVISVDVLDRSLDPSSGILRTERILTLKQSAPALLRRLLPIPDVTYFREVSFLDPKKQTFEAVSNNLSMRTIVDVEERCQFQADPDQPDGRTVFKQRADVQVLGALSYVAKMVEEAAVNSFKTNANKGRQGLETVIDKVLEEARAVEPVLQEQWEAGLEGLRKGTVGV
ncbi:PRELI-like family-domain-containing protein [Phlyctochytrium arcticum]|nr:PRELI-like family-domain-containing protein [Phlyctochytrium arcticum]